MRRTAPGGRFSLDDHFASFLEQLVTSGRYRSHSEAIRTGFRLLEDQETQMAALRSALTDGEASGEAEQFASEFLTRVLRLKGV